MLQQHITLNNRVMFTSYRLDIQHIMILTVIVWLEILLLLSRIGRFRMRSYISQLQCINRNIGLVVSPQERYSIIKGRHITKS